MSVRVVLLSTTASLVLATSALASAQGPSGRYAIDVDATYRAMVEAKVDKPDSRATLEQQKGVMFLDFTDDTLTFVTGPGLGASPRGSCHWTLSGDRFSFDRCRAANGGSFRIDGVVLFESDTGAVIIQGNAPVPIRYRAE